MRESLIVQDLQTMTIDESVLSVSLSRFSFAGATCIP